MGRVFFVLTTLSLMLALLTNRAPLAASALLTSAESGVSLMLTLLGTMTLWSGLMEVLLRTGDVAKLGLLIRKLFGRHSRALPDADCWEAVGMNLAANVLGLGNAATPPGVSAAKQLAAHGEPGLRVLALLLVLNNSSLQVLPTTVLTLRQAAGAHLGRYADFVRRRDGRWGHPAGHVRQNPPKRSESAWKKPPPSPSS